MLGLVGGAPGGHTAAFFVTAYFILSSDRRARAEEKNRAKVKGETSGYPSLDLLLEMHAD